MLCCPQSAIRNPTRFVIYHMKKALLATALLTILALAACTSGDAEPDAAEATEAAGAVETEIDSAGGSAVEVSPEPSDDAAASENAVDESGGSDDSTADAEPDSTATPVTGVLFTYMYGVQLLESQLYEEAIPQLNIVIRRLPELGRGWYYRGLAYRHEGQFEFALEDLNKAIELKPEFGLAYKERGILYTEMGETTKAAEDFEKALSLYHPTSDRPDITETTRLLNELGGSQ